ncbi:MAG: deoxyhypusine synthase family protein [Candidatus Rokuibacteriota bacterium]
MARKLDDPELIREPMTVVEGGRTPSVLAMLTKMRRSAFQGRQLGEAFEVWKKMIEGPSLISLGYAASLSSAGMWPLVTWLMERGYIDALASTSANITEDLLEQLEGTRLYRVDADDVDDERLWVEGYYRFYDHIVSKEKYDQLETRVTSAFINDLAETWRKPSIPTVRFLHEMGLWLEAKGFRRSILATAARCQVPVFCCGLPDGPIGEGFDKAAKADQAPVVDFFRDYKIATDMMDAAMTAGRGTSVVFLGGGVPKDFLQITATSVSSRHGNGDAKPHVAAIQITTDNTIFGGLGGASLKTECISWGKEAKGGDNVMCFADVTLALPLICQALYEHFGPDHRRQLAKPLTLSEVF